MSHFDSRSLGVKLQEMSSSSWAIALETFPREIVNPPASDLVTAIRMRIPGTPPGGESSIRAPRRLAEKRFGDFLLERVFSEMRAKQSSLEPAHCFFSLSHCDNAIVSVAGRGDGLKGVGVDLEPLSRRIAAPVIERVFTSQEQQLGLDKLSLWVVKEACFKANPRNLKTVVTQYFLTSFDKANGLGTAVFNGANGEEEAIQFFCTSISLSGADPKWRIAVAWCR